MGNYVIAKYVRLSMDDAVSESMSIPHQKMILDRHIDSLDIPNAEILEFVDNGHSGTNMERPAVQELIAFVMSGKVNCILVKDFSRFSRNAMDSGYFIEQVFPLYGIRFIAVSDGFDSNNYKGDTGGIDVAFKFLMHEYYSHDLSKKVKSAKHVKMIHGEHIVKNTVYGYLKNDSGKWEPDPASADVVRRIFQMTLDGMTTVQIRDMFTSEKLPTPRQYFAALHNKNMRQSDTWSTRMIVCILQNEQYTGTYIAGKAKSKSVGSHGKVLVDKSEWIVIRDSHTPIVSKEDFAKAQSIHTKYKGSKISKPVDHSWQDEPNRPNKTRMISGNRIAPFPIYGYRKLENGGLEIDETAASVVREIFNLALQGVYCNEIKDIVSAKGYPKPGEYFKIGKGYVITPTCKWTADSVRDTLKNVQYTGAYVSGKILKDYETGRYCRTTESDRIIIPNKFPAIISREDFEKVQETVAKIGAERRKNPVKNYLLKSKIVCGFCGHALKYDDSSAKIVYRCQYTNGNPDAECHKLKIKASDVHESVLETIRKQAEVVLNTNDLSQFRSKGTDANTLADCEKQIRQLDEKRQQLYEQYILREIDREVYQSLKSGYTEQVDSLNNQIRLLKQAERNSMTSKKSAALAKEVLCESATEREIVDALIEKVLVFPGNKIEIRWKSADFV
ncbi:hypothetical protein FACS1894219_12000 [Clostridia bacterium]|nr:hypothetical protein FACS1894219_12000 [Clostridia bacterium]